MQYWPHTVILIWNGIIDQILSSSFAMASSTTNFQTFIFVYDAIIDRRLSFSIVMLPLLRLSTSFDMASLLTEGCHLHWHHAVILNCHIIAEIRHRFLLMTMVWQMVIFVIYPLEIGILIKHTSSLTGLSYTTVMSASLTEDFQPHLLWHSTDRSHPHLH